MEEMMDIFVKMWCLGLLGMFSQKQKKVSSSKGSSSYFFLCISTSDRLLGKME